MSADSFHRGVEQGMKSRPGGVVYNFLPLRSKGGRYANWQTRQDEAIEEAKKEGHPHKGWSPHATHQAAILKLPAYEQN